MVHPKCGQRGLPESSSLDVTGRSHKFRHRSSCPPTPPPLQLPVPDLGVCGRTRVEAGLRRTRPTRAFGDTTGL